MLHVKIHLLDEISNEKRKITERALEKVSIKMKGIGNIIVAVFGMLIYSLWRDRNLLRFQNGSTSAEQICREITAYVHIKSHIHSNWQEHMEALNRYP